MGTDHHRIILRLPQEMMMESRADSAAKAVVSLLKYRGGIPFYRQGQILQ
jgi:hypothetical protein